MSWTTPFTAVTGALILASDWNTSGRDDLLYLYSGRPYASVYNSAAQSLANATTTALTFDSEADDDLAMHSTVTNTNRLTIASGEGGQYLVSAYAEFAANATGQRTLQLRYAGSDTFAKQAVDAAAAGITSLAVTGFYRTVAAQYFEVLGTQSSGGALNVSSFPWFEAMRLR